MQGFFDGTTIAFSKAMQEPATSDLGRLLSVHRGSLSAYGRWWIYLALFALMGTVGLLRAGVTVALSRFPLLLLAVVVAAAWPLRQWQQRVEIFEHGFTWQRFPFAKLTVRRSEIKAVSFETTASRHTVSACIHIELATPANQRTLRISGLADIQTAKNIIASLALPPDLSHHGNWQPPTQKV
jgi:hypothetical protein